MNLLVTGGAGFIGSQFVRAVLSDELDGLHGARLTVLDNLTSAAGFGNLGPVAENERLDFVPGDVADTALVDAVAGGHDAIVHFAHAAPDGVGDSGRPADAGFAGTNVVGTQVLLDAARKHNVSRFLHVSTDAVYGPVTTGPVTTGPVTEGSPVVPRSPYAASKAGADLLTLAYHRTHGLPVVITRGAATYGPHQHPEQLIPRIVTGLLRGRTVQLPGDGGGAHGWLHVADHCRGVALALTRGTPGAVYHIGGTAELTRHDLIARLRDLCDAAPDAVVTAAGGEDHDWRYALDDRKIRGELGYRPRVDFGAGLAETVRWYRDNEAWWRPLVGD